MYMSKEKPSESQLVRKILRSQDVEVCPHSMENTYSQGIKHEKNQMIFVN